MLMVDSVRECIPGSIIRGTKNVSKSDPNLSAEKSLSHLLVVEALAQISVVLAFRTLHFDVTQNEITVFAGIDEARFFQFAVAGDQIELESRVITIRKMMGWFHAEARVGSVLIADARMIAAIRQRP
jgi:3-hydroxyacyl-[acyl-carrier-protein] dehydratase